MRRMDIIAKWGLVVLVSLVISGCRKELPNQPTPVPEKKEQEEKKEEPKAKQHKVSVIVITPEQLQKGEKGTEYGQPAENAMVAVAGTFGLVTEGEKAEVTITPKEEYLLKGIYFAYKEGVYKAEEYPTTADKALVDKAKLEIVVKGDLKVIVLVEEVPYVQQPYAKNVQVDEQYWREQNQKAWNLIYPRRGQLPYKVFWEYLFEAYPSMRWMVKTDTIYTEEPTIMAWELGWKEKGEKQEDCFQVAYALADKGTGELREIYPPVWWDRCTGPVGTVVYPTVPEGEYIEKCFVTLPGTDRSTWYEVPLLQYIPFYFDPRLQPMEKFKEYFPAGYEAWRTKYPVVYENMMEYEDLFFGEEIRYRTVVRRNSADAMPIPRWRKAELYLKGKRKDRGPFMYLGLGDQVDITLSNGCNQRLEGTIHVVIAQKHWMTKHLDLIRHYLQKKQELFPSQGNQQGGLQEWSYVAGKQEVRIAPNEDTQKVTILTPDWDDYEKLGYAWIGDLMLASGSTLFYWQPKGSNEMYLMQQANHPPLNLQQKSGHPWDGWWSHSIDPNPRFGEWNVRYGKSPQLGNEKELFDHYYDFGNSIQ